MFKKGAVVFVVLAALAILVYGLASTGAWFTDRDTINDVAVQSGNLDLQVSNVQRSTPMLEPGGGYKEVLRFCTTNAGNYDMKYRGKLDLAQNDNALASYIQVRAVLNPDESFKGNYGPVGQTLFTDIAATDLLNYNSFIVLAPSTGNTFPFGPGYTSCYSIQATLLSSATNAQQNSTVITHLVLDATQWISQDW